MRASCAGLLLALPLFTDGTVLAQLTTGAIEGTIHDRNGHPVTDVSLLITGAAGFRTVIYSNLNGEFSVSLPYGRYQLSGAPVFVSALQTVRLDLIVSAVEATRSVQMLARTPELWSDTTRGSLYPESFSLPGLLLSREPLSVTEPLDFTGLKSNRLGLESQRGFSWTDVQYKLQGMDATDSYQPGRPVILPDVQTLEEVVVRSSFAQADSSLAGTEVGLFLSGGGKSWHGALSSANTGAALTSSNLPNAASRGLVQQADQFRWFTRDRAEIGGPVTSWADFYASGTGQWASQTEPLASPGTNLDSKLLFGNARGRIRAGKKDLFDALYSGSRINLSDGGIPAGLEAFAGNRLAPSFVLPGGFQGEPEVDHLDFLQMGWTHRLSESSLIEVRYGYSTGHFDTSTQPQGLSHIELLGGTVTGAPPLANLAVRKRHDIEGAWQAPALHAKGTRHQLVFGAGWKTSGLLNRFAAPSDMNLITANSEPAFVMEFNTPLDSRERVRSFESYVADQIRLLPSLSITVGALADFSRGSLPAQSSPAGIFAPARTFAAEPDLIIWNSVSPRGGFAWQVPRARGLVLRASYFRSYVPLAGRYLDFGNANSFGGSVYQWNAPNSNGAFQTAQQRNLLLRFGGPYSSISPSLQRPHTDEFDIGAEFRLAPRSLASVHLFRRDEKNRIAAIDTGVPPQAFLPVSILDPGPDRTPGTFDDQRLTVYAQNPATLGQDRYLLTNPAGLRILNTGFEAKAGTEWRRLMLDASFLAEKSYGPTNPGDAVYENDPGVIGALLLDPNTAIHDSGRSFMDRGYVGKIEGTYRLPAAWGGIELTSVADYTDGLVFARQLLVTGLPQGPFLVATTVRGSPEGGNRAQYALNWNLRATRQFSLPIGKISLSADVLNLANAGHKLQEEDLSGPSFNLRLPVSIQPPRLVRILLQYEF
ncbi:MAG TPA: hypothetical protein VHZ55_17575 [Bryobacteraceae bacterium]|nr:hypothetical protein [Bryobacteraceae bacterium]